VQAVYALEFLTVQPEDNIKLALKSDMVPIYMDVIRERRCRGPHARARALHAQRQQQGLAQVPGARVGPLTARPLRGGVLLNVACGDIQITVLVCLSPQKRISWFCERLESGHASGRRVRLAPTTSS
jgi:hypothetical protein